jgi:hypothetical protein
MCRVGWGEHEFGYSHFGPYADSGTILSAPMHKEAYRKVTEMESIDKFARVAQPDAQYAKPQFVKLLDNIESLQENATAHFEAYFEPKTDPTLTVQWLVNGQPMTTGRTRNLYVQIVNTYSLSMPCTIGLRSSYTRHCECAAVRFGRVHVPHSQSARRRDNQCYLKGCG